MNAPKVRWSRGRATCPKGEIIRYEEYTSKDGVMFFSLFNRQGEDLTYLATERWNPYTGEWHHTVRED